MSSTALLRIASTPATTSAPAVAPLGLPEPQVIALKFESDEKLLLTVVEAAHRLGVGRTLMYELLDSGQIRSVHIGRLRKIPVGALTEFVERCDTQQP